jgi:hypothetical protein
MIVVVVVTTTLYILAVSYVCIRVLSASVKLLFFLKEEEEKLRFVFSLFPGWITQKKVYK